MTQALDNQAMSRYNKDEIIDGLGLKLESEGENKAQRSTSNAPHRIPDSLSDGQRTDAYISLIGTLNRKGMSREAIMAAVKAENKAKGNPPWTEEKVEEKVNDVLDRYASQHGESPARNTKSPTPKLDPAEAAEKAATLREAIAKDRGVAFEDGNLALIQCLQDNYPAEWVRLKEDMSGNLREIEKALKRRKIHLVGDNEPPVKTVADECAKSNLEPPNGAGNLLIPETFALTQDRKIVIMQDMGEFGLKAKPVCDGLMIPTRRLEDVNKDTGVCYEVAFFKNDRWQYIVAPKKTLVDSSEITNLADFDAPISSATGKMTSRFLAEYITHNVDQFLTVKALSKNGWTAPDDAFLLGAEVISDPNIESNYRAAHNQRADAAIFSQKGSLERWKQIIAPSRNYSVPMFLLYAAFGGPILKILRMDSIGIDLYKKTSKAKSLSFMIPASIWGSPTRNGDGPSGGFIVPLDATLAGFEHLCYQRNHTTLITDDSTKNQEKRAALMHELIYMGINSAGRIRSKRQGGVRDVLSWQTVIMTNGEHALMHYTTDGGGRVRFIPLDLAPYGDEKTEETVRITDSLKFDLPDHYGHAGPEFVRWLMKNRASWPGIRTDFQARRKELVGDNPETTVDRMAQACAVVSIAGRLAHQALGFDWDYDDPVSHLWPGIRQKCSAVHTHVRAMAEIADWINKNREKFVDPLDESASKKILFESFGLWKEASTWEYVAINPTVLADELKRRNYTSPDSIFAEWLREGWIIGEPEHNPQRPVKKLQFRNYSARYVCIRRTALEDDTITYPTENSENEESVQALKKIVNAVSACLPLFKPGKGKKMELLLEAIRLHPEDYAEEMAKRIYPYPPEWDKVKR